MNKLNFYIDTVHNRQVTICLKKVKEFMLDEPVYLLVSGISVCSPEDIPNSDIGKLIAFNRINLKKTTYKSKTILFSFHKHIFNKELMEQVAKSIFKDMQYNPYKYIASWGKNKQFQTNSLQLSAL